MSRRIKLTIAALFVALLSIPVVYVVLTWAPAHPLEARLVPTPSSSNASFSEDGNACPFTIELKNTSAVPIYVHTVMIHLAFPSNSIVVDAYREGTDPATGKGDMVPILPGQVRNCAASYFGENTASYPLTGAIVHYEYMSATHWRFYQTGARIYEYTPLFIRERISLPFSNPSTTPLQLP